MPRKMTQHTLPGKIKTLYNNPMKNKFCRIHSSTWNIHPISVKCYDSKKNGEPIDLPFFRKLTQNSKSSLLAITIEVDLLSFVPFLTFFMICNPMDIFKMISINIMPSHISKKKLQVNSQFQVFTHNWLYDKKGLQRTYKV